MNPPPIPPPYRPPQGNKNKWIRPALLAGLIAVPMAIAMVFGLVHAIRIHEQKAAASRAAWEQAKSSANEMQSDFKKNYNPKTGITNVDLEKFSKLKQNLKNISQNSTGEDAVFADVMARHLDRMQTAAQNYQAAATKLREARVLDKFDSSNKAQLAERREIVQRFLDSDAALKLVITSSEDQLRADLTEAKVSDFKIDRFVERVHASTAPRNALVLKIRGCDEQIGAAMLDVLNTLETDWGHWKSDPATDKLLFNNVATRDTYNKDLADIKAAAAEQLRLQGMIVRLPSTPL